MNKIITGLFISFLSFNSVEAQTLAQSLNNNEQVIPKSNAEGMATVYILRPKIYLMSARSIKLNMGLTEKGTKPIKLKNNAWQEFKVIPGEFTLKSVNKGIFLRNQTMNLQVEAGKEYYIYTYFQDLLLSENIEFVEMTAGFGKNKLETIKQKEK